MKTCSRCKRTKDIKKFPNKKSLLHQRNCISCILSHRLELRNAYCYAEEQEQDQRIALDDRLDSLYARDRE